MGCMWLGCCGSEDAAAVRRELMGRDAASRILWVPDPELLPSIARRFAGEELSVALALRGIMPDVAEHVLGDIARDARASSILVFADSDDPGIIARCFYAGATEIVTMSDGPVSRESDAPRAARAGEEGLAAHGERPLVDEEAPPWCEEGVVGSGGTVAGSDSPAAVPDGLGQPARSDACAPAREGAQDTADRVPKRASATPVAAPASPVAAGDPDAPRAPLIAVISGRGGCGRTTLVAAMATVAARAGLRVAVLDLDLMFGTLPLVLGIDSYVGFEGLTAHAGEDGLAERDIEATAMRIGPGLTLWGPCAVPEHAELVSQPIERLVQVLRGMADVILVDTSTFWGDAAAMAVSACERCLVVGSSGAAQVSSARRVIELAARLGVPRTRMTCVFNRVGARGCGEEQALHFEMGVSLRSRARVAYGGDEVTGMASFGRFDSLMAGSGPFAQSVRELTSRLLRELGCPVDAWLLEEEQRRASTEERPRIRLPWSSREREEP